MNDEDKTKKQLIAELDELRDRVREAGTLPELRTAAALCEGVPIGIHECNTEGRITFVNRSQELMTGFTADELMGTYAWERVVPGLERDALPSYFNYLLSEQPAPTPFFAKNTKKNGDEFDVRVDWNYVRNDRGEITGFASIVTDVTELKKAEQALRESERRLKTVISNLPGAVYRCRADPNWTIEFLSDGYLSLTGYDPAQFVGRPARLHSDLIHPDDQQREVDTVLQAIAERRKYQVEYRFHTASGEEKWGWEQGEAVFSDTGELEAIEGFTTDITAQKNAELELRKARAELELRVEERTAELKKEQDALNQMLQASDHERELISFEIHDGVAQRLAGALLYFETASRIEGGIAPEARGSFDAGLAALRAASAEARGLMNRTRTPVLNRFGLKAAIADFIDQCSSTHNAPEITYRCEVQFQRLEPAMENTIFRVAQEAITNACTHSQSDVVRVTLVQQDYQVILDVQDHGNGFDTAAIKENRFGLRGIRERTRLFGKELEIESAPGEGTRIRATFPIGNIQ